jgi:hypothetical protein
LSWPDNAGQGAVRITMDNPIVPGLKVEPNYSDYDDEVTQELLLYYEV